MAEPTDSLSNGCILDTMTTSLNAKDYMALNKLLNKANLQFCNATSLQGNVTEFLKAAKRIFSQDPEELDHDIAVEVVERVMDLTPFDQALEVFTVEEIGHAVTSHVITLVRLACKVLSRSQPKGLFAGTGLIDLILEQLFDASTELEIVNEIEKCLKQLTSDALIRRRILKDNLQLLMRVRSQFDPICASRFLALMNCILPHIDLSEFQDGLFIFDETEIHKALDKDIILFINLTDYYSSYLRTLGATGEQQKSSSWLLGRMLGVVIPAYGKLYKQIHEYYMIETFARRYLFRLFREISMLKDDRYFEKLDSEYLNLTPSNPDFSEFIKSIKPSYLMRVQHDCILRNLTVTPSNLMVWRNLISEESSFNQVKDILTSDAILSLPYYEQMVLLQKLTCYEHSARYLLNDLSKVMSNTLDDKSGSITEPETSELRREVLENLLMFDSEMLNVWSQPTREAYRLIVNGERVQDSTAHVADTYL
ncbi:LAQU0S02e06062g1_1 [Lachancea quebecensis]|uniref:DNA mismatch repair protein HSM3 n=1 Tax=Lachancea quebecensis TaxID=1654605 RepID=A0A0P1KNN7_9SACH|nr:LAQU0S02e06062g1_1 [Lachancea quebecensis]